VQGQLGRHGTWAANFQTAFKREDHSSAFILLKPWLAMVGSASLHPPYLSYLNMKLKTFTHKMELSECL
jgi:hypothetical protein